MRKYLAIFFMGLLITSCSDGDIIEVQLDFDKDLSLCEIETTNQQGNTSENLLFFDSRLKKKFLKKIFIGFDK